MELVWPKANVKKNVFIYLFIYSSVFAIIASAYSIIKFANNLTREE